jgi:uncharacterized repeat protein (TIGR01451 family)
MKRGIAGRLVVALAAQTLVVTMLVGGASAVAPAAPPGCTAATATFTNPTDVPIADDPGSVAASSTNATGLGPYLLDLDVTTFIAHPASGDLDITLTSPQGTIVTLSTDNGSGANVFNGTLWDDDADPDGQVPYVTNEGLVTDAAYTSGVVETPLVPEEAFGAFIGENPNGVWTLRIDDDAPGNTGILGEWRLHFTTLSAAPGTTGATFTNSVDIGIPAGPSVVSSSIPVSGVATYLLDVDITTSIQHTANDDLDVTVASPAGTVMTLTTDNGGFNDNVFNGTVWNDDGDPDGQVPYASNDGLVTDSVYANNVTETPLVPEEAVGAFAGENPNGTWILTISDDLGGEGGTLSDWRLTIFTASCTGEQANLSLVKTDSPDPVGRGGALGYSLTVTNAGPSAATSVLVTDTLPSSVTFVSATPSQGTCGQSGGTVSCPLGTINSGSQATVAIRVTPNVAGTIANSASVSSTVGDPTPANNTDTEQTTVTGGPPPPSDCVGTPGSDILIGTNGRDVCRGLGGNDLVRTRRGNDLALLGPGDDQGRLGAGKDVARAGNGNDVVLGGRGRDTLLLGAGGDTGKGGAGADSIDCGGGVDVARGGPHNDSIDADCESAIP